MNKTTPEAKIIFKTLVKYNALEDFCVLIYSEGRHLRDYFQCHNNSIQGLVDWCRKNAQADPISWAFEWCETKHGDDFWYDLDEIVRQLIREAYKLRQTTLLERPKSYYNPANF